MPNPITFGDNGKEGFQPLPEMIADVKITKFEPQQSSRGNPQLQITVEILAPESYAGKTRNIWYSLVPAAAWKLKGLLDALDIRYDEVGRDNDGNAMVEFDGDELLERCVRYEVKQSTYNNKAKNDWNNEQISDLDPYVEEIRSSANQAAPSNGQNAQAPQQQAAPAVQQAAPAPAAAQQRPLRRRPMGG